MLRIMTLIIGLSHLFTLIIKLYASEVTASNIELHRPYLNAIKDNPHLAQIHHHDPHYPYPYPYPSTFTFTTINHMVSQLEKLRHNPSSMDLEIIDFITPIVNEQFTPEGKFDDLQSITHGIYEITKNSKIEPFARVSGIWNPDPNWKLIQ